MAATEIHTSKTYSPNFTHSIDGENGPELYAEYTESKDTVYSNLSPIGTATSNPSQSTNGISTLYLRKAVVTGDQGNLAKVQEAYGMAVLAASFGTGTWYELDIGYEEAPLLENSHFLSLSTADRELLNQLITEGAGATDKNGDLVVDQISTGGAAADAKNLIIKGKKTYPRPRIIYRVVNENGTFPTTVAGAGQAATPGGSAPNLPSGWRWILAGEQATRIRGKTRRAATYEALEIDADLV